MKPLQLTMSAFGSYGGVEIVDFEKINHGIFLITGDTGAGKTTIFDAVTFALFGETSGQKREPSMMRSQYAGDEEATYVTLKFKEQDRIYEITRSPSYSRISKRKNKNGEYSTISVPGRARLLMPDGREYPGNIRDIGQKVRELIGVDQDQFSQIAMIAQGDYLRLLHASSKERKEIFGRIFNTGIYSRIQMKLKEKYNELYGIMEDNSKLCLHELQTMEFLQDSPFKEPWTGLLEFYETKTDELKEVLSLYLKDMEEQQRKLLERRKEQERALSEAEGLLIRANEVNQLFDSLFKAKEELSALEEQKELWKQKEQQIIKAEQAEKVEVQEQKLLMRIQEEKQAAFRVASLNNQLSGVAADLEAAKQQAQLCSREAAEKAPELVLEITKLQEAMPLYQQCRSKRSAYETEEKAGKQSEERCKKLDTELLELKNKLAGLDLKKEELEKKAAGLSDARQKKEGLLDKNQALTQIFELGKELEEALKNQEEKQKEIYAAQTAYELAETNYNEAYKRFLTVQAGIMAMELEEGKPCPVCGSFSHPEKARLSDSDITEQKVEEAKRARNQAEELRSQKAAEGIQAAGECSHKREQLEKETKKWLGSSIPLEKLKEILPKAIEECSQQASCAEKEEKEAKAAEVQQKKNDAAKKQGEEQKEKLEKKREELLKKHQEESIRAAGLFAELKQLEARLPIIDEKEAVVQLKALEIERVSLLEKEKQAAEHYRKLGEKQKEITGRLAAETENKENMGQAVRKEEESYQQALKEWGFADQDQYHASRKPADTVLKWKNQLKAYEAELLRTRTRCSQYEEQTKGKTRLLTDQWSASRDRLKEELEQLSREENQLAAVNSRARQTEKRLRELWQQRADSEKEFRLYQRLYQTANGKLSGSVSLDFQTYVQRRYFNQMVQAANRRLIVMSDSQFLLQCRDLHTLGKQGEVGLDLDVLNVTAGKIRDVKTLSGGESFMAALAMALGMADVISRTAGNVRIDAMFLDEGFGSLDEESRLRAIGILKELAGDKRLIGIISHVTELKEQIGRKLTVKKTEKGSRIQWDLEE